MIRLARTSGIFRYLLYGIFPSGLCACEFLKGCLQFAGQRAGSAVADLCVINFDHGHDFRRTAEDEAFIHLLDAGFGDRLFKNRDAELWADF